MAKYVPKGVIQTPDLVGRAYEMDMQRFGLARQLAEEEAKKQAQAAAMVSKEKKEYIRNPELRRITQEAWDARTSAGYAYAMNPSPSGLAQYNQANDLYLNTAGQAKALDDKEWSTITSYRAGRPTDYPYTEAEVSSLYGIYNESLRGLNPVTFNQIAVEPFILPKTDDVDILTPNVVAEKVVGDVIDLFESDPAYRNENGTLNKQKAFSYISDRLGKEVEIAPERTGVWGALNQKMIPVEDRGRYNTFTEDQQSEFQKSWIDATNSLITPRIAGLMDKEDAKKTGSGWPSLYAGLRADERAIGQEAFGPQIPEVGKYEGKLDAFSGNIYKLPTQAFIKGDEYIITEFGRDARGNVVVRKQKEVAVPTAFGTSVMEYEDFGWYRANTEDLNLMKNRMKGFYDDYIGSESVSSQEPTKKAVLD